jgi:hypothetical protein
MKTTTANRKRVPASPEADHLTKSARETLTWSIEERLKFARMERWIGYPLAKKILEMMEDLLSRPKSHRMPNLLLVGETNNGKTMIVNRFVGRHPADDNKGGNSIIVPIVCVQAPPVPDESRFYDEILRKLNAPFRENDRASNKQFLVTNLLRKILTQILIIDEFHDILAGGLVHQRNFRNAVKHLGNELRIPIIGVGTEEAFNAVQSDPQLANRFRPVQLPKWAIGDRNDRASDPYLQLLSSFERMLPLKKPSRLTQAAIASKLLGMSCGLIGEIAEVLKEATVSAIKSGEECITPELLSSLTWVAPNERKWILKQGTPNGNGNSSNGESN